MHLEQLHQQSPIMKTQSKSTLCLKKWHWCCTL